MTPNRPGLPEVKKTYVGIDCFKLLFSLLIVFMHTYCRDMGSAGKWIVKNLSGAGVPFFFIASGFFLWSGLKKGGDDGAAASYAKKYFKRLFLMYTFWFVITLPVSWYTWVLGKPTESTLFRVARVFRSFFLSGGTGVYWYLLALLCICPIFYLMRKYKAVKYAVFPVSAILFVIGALYLQEKLGTTVLYTGIYVVFGSERNFLTVGLFYTCIGLLLAEHPVRVNPYIALATLLVSAVVSTFLVAPLCSLLVALSAFVFALNFNPPLPEAVAISMRKLSTGIYLLHFPFILLFDFYLTRGTLIDYFLTLSFSVAVFLVTGLLLPKKIKKIIYG